MLKYNHSLKQFSQKLRREMTDAERKVWSTIRRKQILGVQFYRQKPIGSFIVDFYCPKARLVIELDGSQHYKEEHEAKDAIRDEYLNSLGLKVLRFSNADVFEHFESVTDMIYNEVESRFKK